MDLAGKTAIVTGGTKGIGRAITESLVSAGVNVSISARHEDEIDRAVAELNKAGSGRAAGFFCDVRDDAQDAQHVRRIARGGVLHGHGSPKFAGRVSSRESLRDGITFS